MSAAGWRVAPPAPGEITAAGLPARAALALASLLALTSAVQATAGELAVEAHAGWFDMAASDSAQAVFGSSGGFSFGGAVRYDVWRGAFVSAGVRTFSKEGERVFLAGPGSPVQKLGFPLTLRLTPIQLTAGYRFRRGQLVVPYAGVGVSITSYSETSEVAGESFDLDGTETGFLGVAGVEMGRGRLRGGLELGYSAVSGVLGLGGVSQVYGEDDLGGLHVVGKLVVAFGTRPAKKPAPKKPVPPAGKPKDQGLERRSLNSDPSSTACCPHAPTNSSLDRQSGFSDPTEPQPRR